MSYITILAESVIKNNGGTVLKGGVENQDGVISSYDNNHSPDSLPFASSVVQGINTTVALEDEGSVFAYNSNRPLIKGETVFINNEFLSHDLRTTGTLVPQLISAIHPIFGVRTRLATQAIRNGHFDIYSGKFELGWPDVQYDEFGIDEAATPTRLNPGKLMYSLGGRYVAKNYQSKT